jgi:hypothetical protein
MALQEAVSTFHRLLLGLPNSLASENLDFKDVREFHLPSLPSKNMLLRLAAESRQP